jgi:Ca2+-binding RTX toxin-like protein
LGSLHDLTIDGGAGADTILGADGDDTIIGGTGADVMYGGLGNDTFEVSNIETNGSDSIYFFTTAADAAVVGQDDDLIEFSSADLIAAVGFIDYDGDGTSITLTGAVGTVGFVAGAGAIATDDTAMFVYNTTTGVLSFDADGTGAAATSITIATLYSDDGSTAIADFLSADLTFIA